MADDLKDTILSISEASLDAQLRAVRRLRQSPGETPPRPVRKGMSQVDMAYDILKRARSPLHVSEIIERIERAFGVSVESRKPGLFAQQEGRSPQPLLAPREKHFRPAPGVQVMDLQPLLLQAFLTLTEGWHTVFTQRRLLLRAQHQALGALLVLGRATLSRILWTNGREQRSWSADYFLHSRAKWDPQQLFAPLLKEALRYCRVP